MKQKLCFLLKIQNWRFCNDFVMIGVIKIGDENDEKNELCSIGSRIYFGPFVIDWSCFDF